MTERPVVTVTPVRTCPTCGVAEQRWVVGNVDYVNLSPLTGNCVACLVKLTKEQGPLPKPARPWSAR